MARKAGKRGFSASKLAGTSQPQGGPTPRRWPSLLGDPVLVCIVLLGAGLLLWGLDGRALWQDEAETVLLAQSILRHGVPIGSDGTNVVSQEGGREFTVDSRWPAFLWRWSPWVQFYLAAGSIKLLGPTDFAARLPFVVLGLFTVPATYLLGRRLFASLLVARFSALVLALSVPFLLHTRQARWCGPAYLLTAGMLLCVERLLCRMDIPVRLDQRTDRNVHPTKRGRTAAFVGFVATATPLFYTNYFIAIGLLMAVLPALAAWSLDRRAWLLVAATYFAVGLLTLPGVWFFQVLGRPGNVSLDQVFQHFSLSGGMFVTFLLPIPALGVLCWMLLRRQPETWLAPDWRRNVVFLVLFSLVYLAYVCLAPWVVFRYLTALLPVTAILLGLAVSWIFRRQRLVAAAVVLLLVGTNLFHQVPFALTGAPGTQVRERFPSAGPVHFPLAGFLYEITGTLETPQKLLSQYLHEHAGRKDVVLTTYNDLPLQFYTGLRVVGGLQGQPLPGDNPDWIVICPSMIRNEKGKGLEVVQYIEARGGPEHYERADFSCRDYCLANNPDPIYHLFKADLATPPVVVLHKRVRD